MRVTLMTATITRAWIAMLQTLAAAPTKYCRNMGLPPVLRPFCLVDDVISAVDIRDAAGYQLCTVERQKGRRRTDRSEEHTSELQSPDHLVCRLLLEKKKKNIVGAIL